MAAKQKTARSADSSPAQSVKLKSLAPPPIMQSQAEGKKQLTLEDLRADLKAAVQNSAIELEKNLENKITAQIKEVKEEFTNQIKEVNSELKKVKDTFEDYNTALRKDIVLALGGVWEHTLQLNERMGVLEQENEKNVEQIEEVKQINQNEAVIRQFESMQWALRFRGIKENNQSPEQLRKIMAEAIAAFTGDAIPDCVWQIDKIYRVNSWFAKRKNLPRDIVIYFVTRQARNRVMENSYKGKFMVEGQEIKILKEIPSKMLKSRKEYTFLVEELKRQELQYRWEAPEGVTVTLQGKKYRLTSVLKAKDFYTNILKAGKIPTQTGAEEAAKAEATIQGEFGKKQALEDDDQIGATEKVTEDIFQPLQKSPQIQRQTRAVTKRKEIEAQISMLDTEKQAVGDAKPKSTQKDVDLALQWLAGQGHVK